MNFGNGNNTYISSYPYLQKMAWITRDIGVKPELGVFDLGQVRMARSLIEEGLVDAPPMFQLHLGIPWGWARIPNHRRMGLEDNIHLDRGVLASNADLVRCAAEIIEPLVARVVGADEARKQPGLRYRHSQAFG
jgi:uncharacterized protein (DUF849 family)